MIRHLFIYTSRLRTLIKSIFMLFVLSMPLTIFAQPTANTLKAVYLEKFTAFVTWPQSSQMDNKDIPFIIGVTEETEMLKVLTTVYENQPINNKKVIVKRITDYKQIDSCNILYISEEKDLELKRILTITENLPIITVSSTKGYAEKGTLINFYTKNNKLRFEINETAVLKSPLKMSFFLLKSARIVNPVKDN